MARRRAIPLDTQRQILIESGHRCAVCGTPDPTELAHINPWSKSQDDRPENLICLCANCHERADRKPWSEKELRAYKAKPRISRQSEPAGGLPEATTQVEVIIKIRRKELEPNEERLLHFALAGLLDIPPSSIAIAFARK